MGVNNLHKVVTQLQLNPLVAKLATPGDWIASPPPRHAVTYYAITVLDS